MNGARSLGRLKAAVEDWQMIFFQAGSAFDGASGIDVADDIVGLFAGVAEFEESRWNRVVDDLNHAAADQLLVLHQCQIGLDAGSVAVHHEPYRSRGCKDCDLRVAIAVLLAVGKCVVPDFLAGFDQFWKLSVASSGGHRRTDVVYRRSVHPDYIKEGLAVHIETGAGCARDLGGLCERSC